MVVAFLCGLFRFLEEFFRTFREFDRQAGITRFVIEKFLIGSVTRLGGQGKRILTFALQRRIEGEQIPVAGSNGFLHFVLAVIHAALHAMEFAGRIANDQGRPVVRFCFGKNLDCLRRVSAESDLCDIHVPITHGDFGKTLLANVFPRRGKLANLADVGGFGCLTAGIGIHFGVKHHHIYVFTGSKHMVQSAETDIIGPSVAAKNPDRFFSEVLLFLKHFFGKLAACGGRFFKLGNECFGSGGVLFCAVFGLGEF